MIPQWKGTFERYAWRFAAANHWRVSLVCDDLEDCVAECSVIFCKLCQIYGDTVDNPKWFMALYKQALGRYFVSLARIHKRRAAALEAAQDARSIAPAYEEPVHLSAKLAGASRELRQVLEVIAMAPADLLDMLLPTPQYRFSCSAEQQISRSWCRLAQVGDTVRDDLVVELRELLA